MTIQMFFSGLQQVAFEVAAILSTTAFGVRIIIIMWKPRKR